MSTTHYCATSGIRYIGSIADTFNNSGDGLPVNQPPEPTDPGSPEDDPTD